MSKKNIIQVFEYEKLKFDNTNNDFNELHFNALVKFNEKNDNKYFTIIHKGIKFNSYVGVIQIGGLTIEILPKADKDTSNTKAQKKTWQLVLLEMLTTCKHIKVDNVSETALNKRYNSILEVYFDMYLNEIQRLLKNGLVKKYRRVQSNQLTLKGKILFSQNSQKNIVHKERFYCEHQVYDRDHLIHQILYKGLKILQTFISPQLKDKLNRILYEFVDFKETNITSVHFDKLILNRKTLPYSRSVDIAKMLILNYSPNLNSGSDNMLTLLFDMNKLWEEYIYRILLKHKPLGYNISPQNSEKFWENRKIRPDVVIRTPENKIFIIDTKWKIVDSYKPSDEDLKQMFAYNLYWNCENSLLLYPQINQSDSDFGKYHHIPANNLENKCKLGFVNVLNENSLKAGNILAKDIFRKFKIETQT